MELNAGRETTTSTVANTGGRPVQVSSHFHFFEPGDEQEVDLVAIGGRRRLRGVTGQSGGRIWCCCSFARCGC